MSRARLLLLVPLTLAGLSSFRPVHAGALALSADTRVLQHASIRLGSKKPGGVLRWLRQQRSVRLAEWGLDRQTLEIQFRDGVNAAVLPKRIGTVSLNPGRFHTQFQTLARVNAQGAQALVLEPFASELHLGPNAGDPEVNALKAGGYTVSQAYDAKVTVNTMSTLSQYAFVYVHTHAGITAGGQGLMATGQVANNDPAVSPLIANGSVWPVTVSGTSDTYYAISATYIQNYESPFKHDSILFVNGCNLLSADAFWKALQAKKLGALVSWDKEATSMDNYFTGQAFMTKMLSGLSVAKSVDAVLADGLGTSEYQGEIATLGFKGDGTITLVRNGGSIPTPTVTPTPVPGAKPTITPTPVNLNPPGSSGTPGAPPLSLALQHRVGPGARQIITAHSRRNTLIHFQVTMPTGETLTATATTNQQGVATYSFQQNGNMITHHHLFAKVAVQAGRAPLVTTATGRYRITFGHLDVSAVPRQQTVGKRVTLWVHTKKLTPVLVTLHFPNGVTRKIPSKSATRGWAHLLYTVVPNMTSGANHTVQVSATVQLGKVTYSGATTFSIR